MSAFESLRARRESEAGFALVDALVAIVLLGLAVTMLLQSWGDSISLASRSRRESNVAALVASAAESVLDPIRNPYVNCATAASYDPTKGVGTAPKFTLQVSGVRYWNGSSFGTTCNDNIATYGPLAQIQEVTVVASALDGKASRSVVVVKRSSL